MINIQRKNNQIVGNMGLYYICFELSKMGWNVMPTSRNAKGIDLLIYSQDTKKTYTIQAKALSKRSPVPLGKSLDSLMGDFFIIARNFENPEVFIMKPEDVKNKIHIGQKDGRTSHWLQPKEYETYKDNWKIIGRGD